MNFAFIRKKGRRERISEMQRTLYQQGCGDEGTGHTFICFGRVTDEGASNKCESLFERNTKAEIGLRMQTRLRKIRKDLK